MLCFETSWHLYSNACHVMSCDVLCVHGIIGQDFIVQYIRVVLNTQALHQSVDVTIWSNLSILIETPNINWYHVDTIHDMSWYQGFSSKISLERILGPLAHPIGIAYVKDGSRKQPRRAWQREGELESPPPSENGLVFWLKVKDKKVHVGNVL